MYIGLNSLGLNTAPFAVSPITSLFQNGEPGAVFIASKPTADWITNPSLVTMYQDAAGTTPVTALEQPVGLHLDTRPIYKFPGGGTNPAPNTVGQPLRSAEQFSDAAMAFIQTTRISPGVYRIATPDGTVAQLSQTPGTLLAGMWVEVKFNVDVVTTVGGGSIGIGNTPDATVPLTVGPKRVIYQSSSTSFIIKRAGGVAQDFQVSGLSFKILYGNHRSQASSPARGLLSARYNKVTARNANPVDLTNVTKSGDAAATLTVVNDAAALAAAGLDKLCTLGNVYKLDNSAGAATAWATLSGTTGNLNAHKVVVWARGTGIARLQAVNGTGSSPEPVLTTYATWNAVVTPTTTACGLQVQANAGAVVYFILNDLREACYSYLPTPQIITGTGLTAADCNDSGFPARIVYSGAQGYATAAVDFSSSQQGQAWIGVGKLSDAVISVLIEQGIGGVDTFAWSPVSAPRGAATGNYGSDLRDGVANTTASTAAIYPSPHAAVVHSQGSYSADPRLLVRVNGSQQASANGTTTGTFGNYPLYFGSRQGTGVSLSFTGDEFISIVRGGATPITGTTYSIEQAVGRYMGLNI